jgi:hypothetical protein
LPAPLPEAQIVPVLNQYSLIILMLLIGMLGVWAVRRA